MICAFTGHRPHKLPWGSSEEDPRCRALKVMVSSYIVQAAEQGCSRFLCGMARGCDLYFAEAVLALQAERPELILEAVLPCPEQADRWPSSDRERFLQILSRCGKITVLESQYSEGCMLRRNRAMVDRTDVLITVYDGSGGGTGSTIAYARSRGVRIMPVWV